MALGSTSLLLLGLASLVVADNVVLEPVVSGKTCAAFVLIQGAQVPAERYTPLLQLIQNTTRNVSLWAGSPDFALNTPEPLVIDSGISSILDSMKAKGLDPDSCAIFVGGHSLGGALVQAWTAEQQTSSSSSSLKSDYKIRGQVLLGAFLLRKWRNVTNQGWKYPVSTLTVGGELDGLSRITRMAEAYWHQQLHPYPTADPKQFPLVVLEGVSHFQFASGAVPFVVEERDFRPEVSYQTAHAQIADVIATFLTEKTASPAASTAAAERISGMMEDTAKLLGPLITAFEMEGYYHFLPPCNSNPVTVNCTAGSPWSERAQAMMGGVEARGVTMNVSDRFHPVYQINPIHLPHLWNNCSVPKGCSLNITMVTQNIYETLDDFDTAFVPIAATTMRVKMKSRQTVYLASGITPAEFNTTDAGSICKTINEAAYAWAKEHAAPKTLARFEKLGEPMEFGDDLGPYNAGPLWIWNDMHYKEKKPGPTLLVQAPYMSTPANYWEPTAAGFHYCKLLSPARAMEWIYVDGLRAHDSLSNSTEAAGY